LRRAASAAAGLFDCARTRKDDGEKGGEKERERGGGEGEKRGTSRRFPVCLILFPPAECKGAMEYLRIRIVEGGAGWAKRGELEEATEGRRKGGGKERKRENENMRHFLISVYDVPSFGMAPSESLV